MVGQGSIIFVEEEEPEAFAPPLPPPRRFSPALIGSGIVHTLIMISLIRHEYTPPTHAWPQPETAEAARPPAVRHVFLPKPKDRVSVGAPAPPNKGPMVLRREDDLTKTPKGRPNATPTTPEAAPAAAAAPASRAAGQAGDPLITPGLPLSPGHGALPNGVPGEAQRPGLRAPSIASSLQNLERRLQETGPSGIPSGTGQQMGPLFFDPEGADFTASINHFKNEVYRNWIVPQPALLGVKGHVGLVFTVDRDGRIVALHLVRASGTPAFDRAAQNALQGSRLMPLPADFAPPTVTMQVTFFYNEGPSDAP